MRYLRGYKKIGCPTCAKSHHSSFFCKGRAHSSSQLSSGHTTRSWLHCLGIIYGTPADSRRRVSTRGPSGGIMEIWQCLKMSGLINS